MLHDDIKLNLFITNKSVHCQINISSTISVIKIDKENTTNKQIKKLNKIEVGRSRSEKKLKNQDIKKKRRNNVLTNPSTENIRLTYDIVELKQKRFGESLTIARRIDNKKKGQKFHKRYENIYEKRDTQKKSKGKGSKS